MTPAIEARGLGKVYPRTTKIAGIPLGFSTRGGTPALDGVDLTLNPGTIFALMGPNGAGKTTLVKVLCTLVLPGSGQARVAGYDLQREREVKARIGLVTPNERSFFWRLSCRENLRFFAGLYGITGPRAEARVAELAEQLNLDAFLDKRFDACSTGMKHRLALARGLVHRPRVLFLDEPTRSLDPLAANRFRQQLAPLARQTGLTIFLVTHDVDEAVELAHQAGVMVQGKLRLFQRPEELRQAIAGASSGEVSWESLLDETGPGHGAEVSVQEDGDPQLERVEPPPPARGGFRPLLLFLRRDLLTQLSYRFNFLLDIGGVALIVTAFYYLARLFGDGRSPHLASTGGDYFSFVLVGIAFLGYQNVALRTYADAIRRGQLTGTLEQMLASPLPLAKILLFSGLWPILFGASRMAAYFLVGIFVFKAELGAANIMAALIILVLSILALSGFGVLSAGFIMVFKRGDPVNFLLGGLSVLLGGVYFPVSVLPGWLEFLARFFPLRYTLDAMRGALILGQPISALARDALILLLFSVFLLPLGLLVFRLAVRITRRAGSLSHF